MTPSEKNTSFTDIRPIVLIGMMGAGKSAVGKQLNKKLNRAWIDCDQFIEKEQGLSIRAIFDKYGEGAFRQMEIEAIKKLLQENKNGIISLGGGSFVLAEVRQACREAITVWLKANAQTILNRIGKSAGRPLLQGKTDEDKKTLIENLLKEREPFYQQAILTIEEADSAEEVAACVIDRLQQLEKAQN